MIIENIFYIKIKKKNKKKKLKIKALGEI